MFSFRIVAEKDSGRCTRDYGGKRTEQGYMNSTCDPSVLKSGLNASNRFCVFDFSFLGIPFFFIKIISLLSKRINPSTGTPCAYEKSQI